MARRQYAFRPPTRPYSGTTSGYGNTRADSIGQNPSNPMSYQATQAAKSYKTDKGTTDWDGEAGISPAIK